MRGRAQAFMEERDSHVDLLKAQLRQHGLQPAGGRSSIGGLSRTAPGGQHPSGRASYGPSVLGGGHTSPSQPGVGGVGVLHGAGGSLGSGALAGSGNSVGLTSPAFSGKFSGGMNMMMGGSPRGSPRAHAASGVQQLLPSRGHSRSSSMQMQHGLSPLSAGFSRRASDSSDALGVLGGAADAATGTPAPPAKRSSSSSALQQAAAAAAAAAIETVPAGAAGAEALPLSTLRLQSEGSGFSSAAAGSGSGGRVQLLPLPSDAITPTAAAAVDEMGDVEGEDVEMLSPGALRQHVVAAREELRSWRAEMDAATSQINELREETHHLHSLYQITERDAKYLREVLVSALKSGELHATGTMLQGLSRMLHFTPDELQKISAHSRSTGGGVAGLVGWGLGGLTSPSPTAGYR